jgi:cell division septation protein DedD
MPRNEDGEFELVVGNKQLLSIVFILMVVFGVVFSMGYFVGRANSGSDTPAPAGQQAANQSAGRPDATGAQSAAAAPESTPDASLPPGDARVTTPDTAPSTTPVASAAPAPTATPVATPTPPPAETPKPAVKEPPGGPQPGQTYLQVAAVKKPQADMLVDVLKEKGFHAQTAALAPGGELYRTLVGPLRDSADMAKTKADLEKAGFKPIIKRF